MRPRFILFSLLCLSLTHCADIKNLDTQHEQTLRNQPNGPQLLKRVADFIGSPTKDKRLLDRIMESGNIQGFYDYQQVNGVFEFLLRQYPAVVRGYHQVGRSFQDLPIYALRVGRGDSKSDQTFYNSVYSERDVTVKDTDKNYEPKEDRHKSVMFFNGAHHVRELLTQNMIVRIALEAIHQILHGRSQYLSFWEFSDLLMIPIVNIDGHKFISDSYRKSFDSLPYETNQFNLVNHTNTPGYETAKWKRKNMNSNYCKNDITGVNVGVDLNRNYGFHWGNLEEEDEIECSEVYKGPFPFSEPETQTIQNLLQREKNFVILGLNFHSYGNLWVRPYNFSVEETLNNFKLDAHVLSFYKRMKTNILQLCPYAQVGNAQQMVNYMCKGESSDWMLGELGIVAYSPELGYSDSNYDTFFLPKDLINKALDENFNVIAMLMSNTRFQVKDPHFYIDSDQRFVLEFENPSLGKLYDGIFRFQVSDPQFFKSVSAIAIKQEDQPSFTPNFTVFSKEGKPIWKQAGNGNVELVDAGSEHVGQEAYMEVYLPMLDNLSRISMKMHLNQHVATLGNVEFTFSVIFEDIYELNRFTITHQFSVSGFWKYAFFVAVVFNIFLLLLFILNKLLWGSKLQSEVNKPVDQVKQSIKGSKRERSVSDVGRER